MLESLFKKFAGLQADSFITKGLQHSCFSVNIAKFLKTSILKDICERFWTLLASQGYEYALIMLNRILVCCNWFHKKLGLQSLQICFQGQFYLHIATL